MSTSHCTENSHNFRIEYSYIISQKPKCFVIYLIIFCHNLLNFIIISNCKFTHLFSNGDAAQGNRIKKNEKD